MADFAGMEVCSGRVSRSPLRERLMALRQTSAHIKLWAKRIREAVPSCLLIREVEDIGIGELL